jgi:hypothetical protein
MTIKELTIEQVQLILGKCRNTIKRRISKTKGNEVICR